MSQKWTKEDNEYLIRNYGKIPTSQIVDHLHRPLNTIYAQSYKLGTVRYRRKIYSQEEIDFIANNFGDMTARQIATALNRPIESIESRIRKLGMRPVIPRNNARKYYIVYLAKNDNIIAQGTPKECAEQMGITLKSFYVDVTKYRKNDIKKYVFYEFEEEEADA